MTPEKDSPRTDCRTLDALREATRKNTAMEETKTHNQRELPAVFQPVSSILRAKAAAIFSLICSVSGSMARDTRSRIWQMAPSEISRLKTALTISAIPLLV